MMWQLTDKIQQYFSHSENSFTSLVNDGMIAYFSKSGLFNVVGVSSRELLFQSQMSKPCIFSYLGGKIYFRENNAVSVLDLSDFTFTPLSLVDASNTWILSENLFYTKTPISEGTNDTVFNSELFFREPYSPVYRWNDDFDVISYNGSEVVALANRTKDRIRLIHLKEGSSAVDISLERPFFGNVPPFFGSKEIIFYLGPIYNEGGIILESGRLLSFQVENGQLQWNIPKVPPNFVRSHDAQLLSLTRKYFFEISIDEGKLRRENIGQLMSSLGLSPGGKLASEKSIIYFSSYTKLAAFDFETQEVLWQKNLEKEMLTLGYKTHLDSPFILGDKLFVKDQESTLWIFEKING